MDQTRYPTRTASRDARPPDRTGHAYSRTPAGESERPRATARRREAVDHAKLIRRAVLPVALAAVILLVGLPTPLGRSVFVSVNGSPVAVPAGTLVGDLSSLDGLSVRQGALVDVAGDVIRMTGGGAGAVRLNGAPGLSGQELSDGDVLLVRRGADAAEPLERREKSIPFDTRTEGSGSVLLVAQPGRPGVKAVYSGRSSDRVVLEYVAADPVDAVFRRTSGLSAGQKAVALTFDDGPSEYTRGILKVLADKGVSATFFMLGRSAAGNQSLVRAVRDAGHAVENHSYSHADFKTLSAEAIRNEITKASSVLGGTHFVRPPYGSYNATATNEAGKLGQRIVLWDVDTLDWKTRDPAAILAKVKAQTRPGAIILMHDGGGDRSQTVAALPAVIDWLLAQGYALTTVHKLAG